MLVTKFIKQAKTESAGQIKNDIWFQLITNINHNGSYYYDTMSSDIVFTHLMGGTLQSITSVLCCIIDGDILSVPDKLLQQYFTSPLSFCQCLDKRNKNSYQFADFTIAFGNSSATQNNEIIVIIFVFLILHINLGVVLLLHRNRYFQFITKPNFKYQQNVQPYLYYYKYYYKRKTTS